jgi:hypothetical protein
MRAVSRALSWARPSRRARIAARAMAVQASCDQGTCDPCQRSKDARPLKVVRVNAGVTQRLLRSSSALSTKRAGGRGPCAAIKPQATQQEDLLTTRAKAMPFSTSHRKGRASSQRAGQLHHRVHRKRLHPGLSCSALGCAGLGRNGVGHEGSNLTFASFSRSHAPFVVPQGEWNRECLLRAVVGQLITVFTTHHHKGGTWDGRARSPSDQLLPPLGRRRGPDNTSRSYASADRAPLGFLSSYGCSQGATDEGQGNAAIGQGATSRWSTKSSGTTDCLNPFSSQTPARGVEEESGAPWGHSPSCGTGHEDPTSER